MENTPEKNISEELEILKKQYPKEFKYLYDREIIGVKNLEKGKEIIRILQFNILADSNSFPKQFTKVNKKCLKWEYRGFRIVEELVRWNAGIITLQECDRFDVKQDPRASFPPLVCTYLPRTVHFIVFKELRWNSLPQSEIGM